MSVPRHFVSTMVSDISVILPSPHAVTTGSPAGSSNEVVDVADVTVYAMRKRSSMSGKQVHLVCVAEKNPEPLYFGRSRTAKGPARKIGVPWRAHSAATCMLIVGGEVCVHGLGGTSAPSCEVAKSVVRLYASHFALERQRTCHAIDSARVKISGCPNCVALRAAQRLPSRRMASAVRAPRCYTSCSQALHLTLQSLCAPQQLSDMVHQVSSPRAARSGRCVSRGQLNGSIKYVP